MAEAPSTPPTIVTPSPAARLPSSINNSSVPVAILQRILYDLGGIDNNFNQNYQNHLNNLTGTIQLLESGYQTNHINPLGAEELTSLVEIYFGKGETESY